MSENQINRIITPETRKEIFQLPILRYKIDWVSYWTIITTGEINNNKLVYNIFMEISIQVVEKYNRAYVSEVVERNYMKDQEQLANKVCQYLYYKITPSYLFSKISHTPSTPLEKKYLKNMVYKIANNYFKSLLRLQRTNEKKLTKTIINRLNTLVYQIDKDNKIQDIIFNQSFSQQEVDEKIKIIQEMKTFSKEELDELIQYIISNSYMSLDIEMSDDDSDFQFIETIDKNKKELTEDELFENDIYMDITFCDKIRFNKLLRMISGNHENQSARPILNDIYCERHLRYFGIYGAVYDLNGLPDFQYYKNEAIKKHNASGYATIENLILSRMIKCPVKDGIKDFYKTIEIKLINNNPIFKFYTSRTSDYIYSFNILNYTIYSKIINPLAIDENNFEYEYLSKDRTLFTLKSLQKANFIVSLPDDLPDDFSFTVVDMICSPRSGMLQAIIIEYQEEKTRIEVYSETETIQQDN